MKNARLFIYNGLILTAASLILRTVGVGFNIFITSRVGAAGTGLFQLVMSVYSPALTLASAGVSLASSRLVAEELGKNRGGRWRDVLIRCLIYSFAASLPVAAALFTLAPSISSSWLGSSDASHLLRILSVGLPFISLSSCINGFFTALRKAKHTAAVQLSEQLFKIILTCILIYSLSGDGFICLLAVVFGNVCSDIFSMMLSSYICARESRKLRYSAKKTSEGISARILSITLPVSISSFLRSSLVALEHILIPKGLKKSGMNYVSAMAAYGTLTGMAMPIIMFPASFLYSFSSLVVPEMAEAKERGENEEIRLKIKQILYAFLIFSVGAAGLIFGYCDHLGKAIYGSSEVSRFLLLLAPLIPIMYLDNIADSMLKGLGEQIFTMKVNVIDAASCVLSVLFLVPRMGIMGYVLVILISELINFGFSIYRLKRVTGAKPRLLSRLPRLLICVLCALVISRPVTLLFNSSVASSIFGVAVGSLAYLFLIYVSGALKINPRTLTDKVIKRRGVPYNEADKAERRENVA